MEQVCYNDSFSKRVLGERMMNKNRIASELIMVAKDLVAGGKIGINEVRRELKKLGFKVRLKNLSWGPHAEFYDYEGNAFPSMFSKETLERWKPLIDYKKGLNRRYDAVIDKHENFIYGFDFKKNKFSSKLASGRIANRLKWKKMIEMPNNSAYIGVEKPKNLPGGRRSGSVYVFSATPFSAKSILKDAQRAYPRNEVVMKIRKREKTEGYDAFIYEIYVIMGDDKEASQRLAASVSARDILKGYLTTALWSETDDDGDNLDSNYNIRDIAGASLRGARSDINKFIKQAGDLLDLDGNKGSQIGHDLWLNRNGHGAGFWDGDYPEAGKELDKIASRMGGKYIYVGDDGKVYID